MFEYYAPLFVEYMRGRLEVQRDASVLKDERGGVGENGVSAFVEDGRATYVAGDFARDVVLSCPFLGAEKMQTVVIILDHANCGLHRQRKVSHAIVAVRQVKHWHTLGKMTAHWKGAP